MKKDQQVLSCPAMPLEEYIRACMQKHGAPATIQALLMNPNSSQNLKDILCVLSTLGALEPLSAIRPGVCDNVMVYDKTVEVDEATIDAVTGKITPKDGLLIQTCASMGQVLVIEHLRGLAANLTASEFGEVVRKRAGFTSFSEDFCPPGQPATGDDLGTFQNIEHVIACPESGFDIYGRNHDPYSKALFHVHAKMWLTC